MDDYLKEALEIVRAQAKVRVMTSQEIVSMVRNLMHGLKAVVQGGSGASSPTAQEDAKGKPLDAKKAIREKSIICMESGKSMKVITKRHLAKYGLTPDEYRAKWGYSKDTPLVCKELQRARRKKMQDMRLWERRKKPE
ncbi:Transcriptional regulatory protein ros [Fundidesulfovibrio magnetotacticus]|uniref:Transcriptional regulatory protein ros n=1 Tax=Fundidesulfovibrio magnetotacticus TaxID=2730080 RepID=A0A6V8LT15_9BACT|nr:MucR family transcriptional regulator [Fundidesulfovibrio magnetotacticus]GFK92777.1 Transcriptional regulatory protein ros [Fundidesulfovibrio magnetotacticus]